MAGRRRYIGQWRRLASNAEGSMLLFSVCVVVIGDVERGSRCQRRSAHRSLCIKGVASRIARLVQVQRAHRRCKAQAEQRKASFQLAAGLRYTKPCAATICEPPEAVDGPLPHDLFGDLLPLGLLSHTLLLHQLPFFRPPTPAGSDACRFAQPAVPQSVILCIHHCDLPVAADSRYVARNAPNIHRTHRNSIFSIPIATLLPPTTHGCHGADKALDAWAHASFQSLAASSHALRRKQAGGRV
jgi:hypothetical protein